MKLRKTLFIKVCFYVQSIYTNREVNDMKYALLGDLHSSVKHTKAVLTHIEKEGLTTLIGLGDLYECKIGKKKLATLTELIPVEEAAIISEKFESLLTFPSVIGNQEERIAQVTGNTKFLQYAQEIFIEHATIKHGHQFTYDEQFHLQMPTFETPFLFFGHSHYSALYDGQVRTAIEFDRPYVLNDGKQYVINVGSVVDKNEWCMYDSESMSVTFKKAK